MVVESEKDIGLVLTMILFVAGAVSGIYKKWSHKIT
jgi:hypothetical protein